MLRSAQRMERSLSRMSVSDAGRGRFRPAGRWCRECRDRTWFRFPVLVTVPGIETEILSPSFRALARSSLSSCSKGARTDGRQEEGEGCVSGCAAGCPFCARLRQGGCRRRSLSWSVAGESAVDDAGLKRGCAGGKRLDCVHGAVCFGGVQRGRRRTACRTSIYCLVHGQAYPSVAHRVRLAWRSGLAVQARPAVESGEGAGTVGDGKTPENICSRFVP